MSAKLTGVAEELREFLHPAASAAAGEHFAAALAAVELTIALHYVFDTPHDRLVWDAGHQAYPHKALTGRRARLHTIKQHGGLAPFPIRSESEYDTFGVRPLEHLGQRRPRAWRSPPRSAGRSAARWPSSATAR